MCAWGRWVEGEEEKYLEEGRKMRQTYSHQYFHAMQVVVIVLTFVFECV